MIFKALFLFTVILSLVKLGETLRCYGCLTSTSSDCFDGVQSSYFIQECEATINTNFNLIPLLNTTNLLKTEENANARPIRTVCTHLTYVDPTPKIFIRGCGYIYEGVDVCEYLELIGNVEGCKSCENDLCNIEPGNAD